MHGIGQRAGDEAGVLAGEEHDHELRPRLGHDRDAITPREPGVQQPERGGQRLLAQAPVGQGLGQFAARGIEIEAGFAPGRIVETLGEGGEIAHALLKRSVGARRRPWRIGAPRRCGAFQNVVKPQDMYPS
jgi:hypothetical protein